MPDLFSGSFMNGPDVNLVDYVGLEFSDEDSDILWSNINPIDLIELCGGIVYTTDQSDEMPGYSDKYYTVSVGNEAVFKKNLRQYILKIVGSGR